MTKLLLIATAAMALAGAAHAADNDGPSRAISTRGVNLDDSAQAQSFYNRLETAAGQVCRGSLSDVRLSGMSDSACIRLTITDAVNKVGAPRLVALLNNASGSDHTARAFAADAR
jgi:UrcA family protein